MNALTIKPHPSHATERAMQRIANSMNSPEAEPEPYLPRTVADAISKHELQQEAIFEALGKAVDALEDIEKEPNGECSRIRAKLTLKWIKTTLGCDHV